MRFDILTLFPEFFDSPLNSGMMKRAIESELIGVHVHNIRDWTTDKHRMCDDTPYGGGGGMVMKPDPVVAAVRGVREKIASEGKQSKVVYMSPQGRPLTKTIVDELAALDGIILLCGNYEGIDERAIEAVVEDEISIGDYVLTGGELAALVVLNAVSRKIPGVLGNEASAANDSFEDGLLDFPHYTRPEEFEGVPIPTVLASGHHGKIAEWRRQQALLRTAKRRPDLLEKAKLTKADEKFLRENVKKESE